MKKSLRVRDVFSIATGAMIGSGFFLLPGIAYGKAGPAVVVSYFLAAVLIIPALLSNTELATAVPRSGGTYFFVSRSIGALAGVVDGLGTWVVMVAKSSFALVGIGYYIAMVAGWPDEANLGIFVKALAVVVVLILAGINAFGVRKTGSFQSVLVAALIALSVYFISFGAFEMETSRLTPFAPHGLTAVLATTALVFVSYAGLTKVTSVSEEVRDPEKTIPRGMFLSLGVTTLVYVLGVLVVVGVMPGEELAHNLTPLASAAGAFAGRAGVVAMVIAGVLAFVTTANAGVLAASRYLYAMGRDRVVPKCLGRLSRRETPLLGIAVSTLTMIVVVVSLDAVGIAKLASTFLLVEFAAVNLSVIVMRESRVGSYDPGFRSPGYPYVQIAGVIISIVLIPLLGWVALVFALSLFAAALLWYLGYSRARTGHAAAIRHVLERIATEILSREAAGPALDRELREIMKEKGLRERDPFVELVRSAAVIDLPDDAEWEELMRQAAEHFSREHPAQAGAISEGLLEMARLGRTPAADGVALPHLRMEGIERYELIIARSKKGLHFPGVESPVHAVFVLLGSTGDPQQHLRMLAGIAGRAEQRDFLKRWLAAPEARQVRETLYTREELRKYGGEDS